MANPTNVDKKVWTVSTGMGYASAVILQGATWYGGGVATASGTLCDGDGDRIFKAVGNRDTLYFPAGLHVIGVSTSQLVVSDGSHFNVYIQ